MVQIIMSMAFECNLGRQPESSTSLPQVFRKSSTMKKTGGLQQILFILNRLRGLAIRVAFDFNHE